MTDIRCAPYPDTTRAKGWRFELDMELARQSDTWTLAAPDVRPWLLMLWATAWEQTPCGSMPDDDELIAARLGMPAKVFAKHKSILLRRWWKADDGRLYHDVLVRRVTEMMERRRKESDRKALARAKKLQESGDDPDPSRTSPTVVPRDNDGTHVGFHPQGDTGTGTGVNTVSIPTVSHPPAKADGQKSHTVPCPYDAIVAAYHEALPTLPRARLMPAKRQAALRKVWGWVLSSRKSDGTRRAETAADALAWLRNYFARAGDNDFLMGRGARSAEHAGWQCDIDFLLSDKGMKHVIEKTLEAA